MATQYTSLLGLALPVTGELSGTWGDTVNDAITSLLDSAVAGTTTLNTDADVTLTTTTGAANQARQAIILWTANGTTTRNITAPAQSKIYTVINASAGTQSIVFRGVGPTAGVTVVKGESAVVAWNGSDFIKISNTGGGGSFTNVTISGTTTLSGLTASTALALNASKEVVSVTNTGTGNNVLATSPVLTTPNLGTPSAVTLTNATGLPVSTGISGLGTGVATALAVNTGTAGAFVVNGGALGTPSSGTVTNLTGTASININGTVGATTPATGAFTTLTTSSTVTLNGGTANGVAYLNGSKVLTTGSALTFDGTNLNFSSGYFGIAAQKVIGSGNGYAGNSSAASSGTLELWDSSGGINLSNNWGLGSIKFGIGGSEQMRLTSTGLGIGTSSPTEKLDVTGNFKLSGSATLSGGTANGVAYLNSSKVLTTGSALTFDGNAKLTVNGGSSLNGELQLIRSSGFPGNFTLTAGGVDSVSNITLYDTTSGYVAAYRHVSGASGYHNWFQNGSEAMRLTSTGLGIGTSSPISYARLTLEKSGGDSAIALVKTGGAQNAYLAADGTNAWIGSSFGSTGKKFFVSLTAPDSAATIDSSGNLGLGVTPSAWSSSWKSLQLGNSIALYGRGSGANITYLGNNVYINASGLDTYIASDFATTYRQYLGGHAWFTAPSGTAGNAISFSQVMTLDASGNLGIGTSSPDVKLRITGANVASKGQLMLDSTNFSQMSFYNGATRYAQIYADVSGSNTGMYIIAATAQPMIFSTSDAERMRIDASGNLGLGVTPSAWSSSWRAVELAGGSLSADTGGTTLFAYQNTFFNGTSYIYKTTAAASYYSQNSGAHTWYTAPSGTAGNAISFSQVMTLSASGGLSLGDTSDPGSGVGSFNGVRIGGNGTDINSTFNGASSILAFKINGSERARIDSSGNLLVGTTSGSNKLTVNGSAVLLANGQMKFADATNQAVSYITNSGGANTSQLEFWTGATPAERARIDSSGNLLVGTTSTLSSFSGARASFVGASGFVAQTNQDASYECGAFWHPATSGNNIFAIFGTEATYTTRGSITYNRGAGLVAYNTTSDYRAKDVSGPLIDSGAVIDSVPVYMGKMKGATQERPMFIAHEVPAYAHTGEKDAVDADGNPVYQQMDASALIPVMWAEIKSLRQRLAAAGI